MSEIQLKQERPLVSVVIPFYSGAEWLEEAVESVLAQDYDRYEIIIVNDGSKEDLTSFLEKYGDKIVYLTQENQGAAVARNAAIDVAQGKYVAFLDADDLWTKDKLSLQIKKMEETGVAWSYTDFETFGEGFETRQKGMAPFIEEGIYKNFSPYIGVPTVVFRREVFDEDNGIRFAGRFRYGEDVLFWRKLIWKYDVLFIPNVLCRVRLRGTNAGRRAAVQLKSKVANWKYCVETLPGFKKKASFLYKTAIAFCRVGNLFIKENKKKGNEFFAKVFYSLPYVMFRLDRKINRKKIIEGKRIF